MPDFGSDASSDARLARLERAIAELRATNDMGENSKATVHGRFAQGSDRTDTPDSRKLLGSEESERTRTASERYGLADSFGSLFDESTRRSSRRMPTPLLSEPPRRVPLALKLAGLSWKWWEAFAILMVFTAPIALWLFAPRSLPAAFIGLVVILGYTRVRAVGIKTEVLRWGKVATVTQVDHGPTGTYFSGTTYSNVRLAQASGWAVKRQWYSGPGSTTRVHYLLDGSTGELTVRGLPYTSGVILASARDSSKALCVSDFPYDLEVDEHGGWRSTVGTRSWIGIIATMTVYAALVTGAVWTTSALWLT